MPGENQLKLLESLPVEILNHIIKSLNAAGCEILLLLLITSKTLRHNIIPPRYEEIIPWLLIASPEQIHSFINYYRTTKECTQLKSMQFTKNDTLALICFMFVTDDINTLPVPLLEALLQQKESPCPQLAQAQWEFLKTSIKATLAALKYNSSNANDLKEALQQAKCFVNLSGARLPNVDLSSMNLQKVCLEAVDLQKANLTKADLQGVNLKQANLKRAILITSNMTRSNLQRSNLTGASLIQANLQNAQLEETQLQEADLKETQMHGAKLNGTHFINVTSDKSDLKIQLKTIYDKQTKNHKQKKLLLDSILSDLFRKVTQNENKKELLEMAFTHKIFGSNPTLLFLEKHMSPLLTASQIKIKKALAELQLKKTCGLWRLIARCENNQIHAGRAH